MPAPSLPLPTSALPSVTLIPARPAVRRGAETVVTVLARITAPERPVATERPRLNLAFAIDISGSMGGEKLDCAKRAAIHALGQLRDDDRVAIVTFDSTVEVVVPSTSARNRGRIEAAIQRLETRGMTALHEGWRVAGMQVAEHLDAAALNRVVLLTDGQANVGISDAPTIADHVRTLAARGVSTSAFGIGRDYNEDLLEAVADAGDGSYAFIASPEDLPTIFAAELAGLSATFARGLRLRLSRAPGVVLDAVLNDLPSTSGVVLDDRLADPDGAIHGLGGLVAQPGRWSWSELPNLLYGQTRDIAFRLRVRTGEGHTGDGHSGDGHTGDVAIAEAVLSWIPAGSERRTGAVLDVLALPAVSAAEYDAMSDDLAVTAAVARQESAQFVREAASHAERGDVVRARRSMGSARTVAAAYSHTPAYSEDIAAYDRTEAFFHSNDAGLAAKEAKAAAFRGKRSE